MWRTRTGDVKVVRDAAHERAVEESSMSTTPLKKRTTAASNTTEAPSRKGTAGSTEPAPSKDLTTSIGVVVRRPAVPASAETTTSKPEATTKPKKPTYEARMRALAPVARLRRKLESNERRVVKLAREVRRWANAPELRDAATAVTTALTAMLAVATALPDDFKPERERKGSKRQVSIGMKVTLREKVSAKYDGILGGEERKDLEVVALTAKHVSVKTSAGALVVLPRAHVASAQQETRERTAAVTTARVQVSGLPTTSSGRDAPHGERSPRQDLHAASSPPQSHGNCT